MEEKDSSWNEKSCGFCGNNLEEEEDYCPECGTDYTKYTE